MKRYVRVLGMVLKARYGIEVVSPGSGTNLSDCDVIVLVRTWQYGVFRVYSEQKKDKPLRPFHMVEVTGSSPVARTIFLALSQRLTHCTSFSGTSGNNPKHPRTSGSILRIFYAWVFLG